MTYEDVATAASNLFHAYDIRIDRADMSYEVFLRLCDAEAVYFHDVLKTDKLLICRDTRLGSDELLQTAINRFSELGFAVDACINPISTCQFYYSASKRPDYAGIMITASHNPPDYTGEKIVCQNAEPIAYEIGPAGGLAYIKSAFEKGEQLHTTSKGRITVIQETNEYVDFSIRKAGLADGQLEGITILADFMSGSVGNEIMLAFERLGASVIPLNLVTNGHFPAGTPNPAVKENVKSTLAIAEKMKGEFDFMFIFDGDGDRLSIYDSGITPVSPSVILAFLAGTLERICGNGRNVGLDPKAVPPIKSMLRSQGFEPFLIPNGHSFIKAMIKDGEISFAAEETAHYYMKLVNPLGGSIYENTLLIAILFSSLWKSDRARLDSLISTQRSVFSKPEWSYFLPTAEQQKSIMSKIDRYFLGNGYSMTDNLPDGSPLGATILEWSDGNEWVYLTQRSSQSEKGLVRIMLYASSEALIQENAMQIDEIAKGVII